MDTYLMVYQCHALADSQINYLQLSNNDYNINYRG